MPTYPEAPGQFPAERHCPRCHADLCRDAGFSAVARPPGFLGGGAQQWGWPQDLGVFLFLADLLALRDRMALALVLPAEHR
jgi:hypothetical protein